MGLFFNQLKMEEEQFDKLGAEQRELDVLLGRGVHFDVPARSLIARLQKKKTRRFEIHQPYLGTLDLLSQEFLRMGFDEQQLADDAFGESKRLVLRNARRAARVVAIAVLNSRWKCLFLTGLLAQYFVWRVTPAKLAQLAMLISQVSNLGDFTNSIRLLSVNRTTNPALMEKTGPKVD